MDSPQTASITKEEQGLVFLIQGYSVQDGPGLRTTVFMKGCPLRCRWCQNPESLEPHPELMSRNTKCLLLGKCVEACPVKAISIDFWEGRKIDRARCDLCFKCVDACPSKALGKVGEYMTVPEVMAGIMRDQLFHRRSSGGVTISGGEPLLQWRFVYKLLQACKERHLHTALDTCGYAPWPALERVLEHVNLVLYDIKHMDPKRHKEATGKSNQLILRNVRRIPRSVAVWLRLPLVPGFNDSEENLTGLGELGLEIGAEKVSILPYHKLALEKCDQLGVEHDTVCYEEPSQEHLEKIQAFFQGLGLKATIGN